MALGEDFEVTTAASAEEALSRLDRDRPEAMVLDQNMPGMSGLGLLESLGGQAVPGTVMLSALVDVDLVRQAMHLGVDDLMSKPCNVAELKRSLHKASENAHCGPQELVPFALRGARALERAQEQQGSLPERTRRLSKAVLAEAVSECRSDRELAARRLGMDLEELKRLSADLL
jgi:DNA-binding NtrC family response regulator